MGFPATQKTWTIQANVAIAGATLNIMMGVYLKAVADFLLANGYTCKGSSDGIVAAMDGVNRWVNAVDAGIRGATTILPQSWMVLTDGNGCNLLLAYMGGTDDAAQISFSPSGVYVAAGTPTNTPTATDEVVMATATSVINSTAAVTNRTLFGWVDSEAKLCRTLLSLNSTGSPCGVAWGLELFDSSLQQRTISPSVWGFAFAASAGEFGYGPGLTNGISGAFSASVRGGRSRVNGQLLNMNCGIYEFTGDDFLWSDVNTELQGTDGYPIWGPFRLGSAVASWTGVAGTLFDWWSCRNTNNGVTCNLGDTLNAKAFMVVGATGGIMWPWDGATTPANGARASLTQLGTVAGTANADPPSYGTFMEGASQYVPLSNSNVTPTGPSAPKAIARRAGVDVIRLNTLSADPPAETGRVVMYTRLVGGQQALFSRYPDGTVYTVGVG